MIELSNSTTQTIEPGGTATFDIVIMKTGCDTCHREGSGLIQLTGRSNSCCNPPKYILNYSGNLGGGANTQANIAIAVNGEPLKETIRVATITADTDVFPFAATTTMELCGNVGSTVTVKNVGTTPITLANPIFRAGRSS